MVTKRMSSRESATGMWGVAPGVWSLSPSLCVTELLVVLFTGDTIRKGMLAKPKNSRVVPH